MNDRPSRSSVERQRSTLLIQISLIASLLLLIGLFSLHWTSPPPEPYEFVPLEPNEHNFLPPVTEAAERPPQPLPPVGIDDLELGEDPELEMYDIEPPESMPVMPPAIEPPAPAVSENGSHDFVALEREPEIVGGLQALQRRVRYPERARQIGIEGTVFVQFMVDEYGRASDITCTRDPGGGTCEAAMEAIRRSEFRPGIQGDRPVRARMSIPVRFELR